MKVVVSEKSPIERTVEVQVDSELIRRSYDRRLNEAARMMAIPGFRKGKAPRHIVERHANQEALRRSVFEDVGVPAYEQALKQEKLEPVGQPQLEFVQFDPTKDLIFKATFEIRPEVKMEAADYEGLEVSLEKTEISDEDVQKVLEDFQKKAERTVTVDEDRGLERGDAAVLDFDSRIGEEPVPNGKAEDFQFDVDDTLFVPGFADNLVGVKVGESKTFDFEFPETYQNKALAGNNVTFRFELKAIKKRELPALDDELAKEASRFPTLDDWKVNIRERLERNLKAEIGSHALDVLAQKKDFPLPHAFVHQTIQLILQNQARQLASVGVKFEDFLKSRNISIESVVEDLHPQAERLARAEMIREAVVAEEKLEAGDVEMEAEIQRFAEVTNQNAESVRSSLEESNDLDSFRREIVRQKVLQFLAGKARVVKAEPKAEAPEAEGPGAREQEATAAVEQEAPAATTPEKASSEEKAE